MCDTKKSWFSRVKAIVVAFALAPVFFFGFLAIKEVLQKGLLPLASDFVPNFHDELYHDIGASVALLIIALIFRCSGRVGLKWPDSKSGWAALAVLLCYLAAYNLNGGIFFAHLTFQMVFFVVLTKGLTGFWEELFYRGFLMAILRPCGVLGSLLISSALFGIVHVDFSNEFFQFGRFLITATAGLMFAVNRMQTNSILPAAIAHGANNAVNVLFSDSPDSAFVSNPVIEEWIKVGISVPILIYCFVTIRKNLSDWKKLSAAASQKG